MEKLLYSFTAITVSLALIVQICVSDDIDDFLTEQWKAVTTTYLRHDATKEFLDLMKGAFPDYMDYYSIGASVQGREMYVAKLRKAITINRPALVPRLKMVGSIHGDETLGKQLLLMLIIDLLKEQKANNPRIMRILEHTEIHLLLTMNPDGYEVAKEGECSPAENILGRLNANLKDLNQDFPDIFAYTAQNEPPFEKKLEDRQPETQNVMTWIHENNFVSSVSFTAGDIVASYPYNAVPLSVESKADYKGKGIPSTESDVDTFVDLATIYAKNHKTMTGDNCGKKGLFKGGIINGAKWHNVRGTMGDFNNHGYKCYEISVGVSCCKSVTASAFATEWKNNKESLYKFIEAVHKGIKGTVRKDRKPYPKAVVRVQGNMPKYTDERGEYWKLLVPGEYKVKAVGSENGGPKAPEITVKVKDKQPPVAIIQDFDLK